MDAKEILRLYAKGIGNQRIAAMLQISTVTVYRVLKRNGVALRARGKRGEACVEDGCGKPTGGSERCPLHKKLRTAEMNRIYKQWKEDKKKPKTPPKKKLEIGDESWDYGMAHFVAKLAWQGD